MISADGPKTIGGGLGPLRVAARSPPSRLRQGAPLRAPFCLPAIKLNTGFQLSAKPTEFWELIVKPNAKNVGVRVSQLRCNNCHVSLRNNEEQAHCYGATETVGAAF